MTARTSQLLDTVDAAHDWETGQTYGGGGTKYSRTDRCRICGLERRYLDDSQNGIDNQHTFADARGNPLTLRDAAQAEC